MKGPLRAMPKQKLEERALSLHEQLASLQSSDGDSWDSVKAVSAEYEKVRAELHRRFVRSRK